MPPIVLTNDSKDSQFDGVIVVTDSLEHLPTALQSVQCTVKDYLKVPAIALLSLICLLELDAEVSELGDALASM